MTDAATVSIVVPTKNEAGNIEPLLQRIVGSLGTHSQAEVVFVDDSDDDTPRRILDVPCPLPVRLIHRAESERRGGLGSAVLEGFRSASGAILVVMDADLQHPPELIPSLVLPLEDGRADIAVASRFVDGGQSSGLSGPVRKAAAGGTRFLAGRVLPTVRSVSDPMSGYFSLKRSVLASGPKASDGFKILLDVLACGTWASVVEVPYVFSERESGESKASATVGVAYLKQLWRLRRLVS